MVKRLQVTYPIRLIVEEVSKVLPEERNGQIGDIEVDNYSVPTSNLTLTLCEAPNEKAIEVPRPNSSTENSRNRTQLPGQSYELKIWVLERPRGNTFMIDARELSITWSHDSNHWTWLTLTNQSPNESAVEIAFLRNACWLDVAGKFDTRYLSPMTRYQVVFVVLLQYTKTEWKKPVKLKLVLPKGMGKPQERSVNMVNHITNEWVDILVGEFTTSNKNIGEISFVMYEHNSKMWKSGLFIKGVAIRPKY
ncbi:protein PHLOEM PROTEIN 2-LIKE A5 [Capsella rubella]|uniref:protein PHLOEM PROTEIN 2-LIKE A5 n=1 Tax=Capsella rubella TaxID=81985 RepID=UPI000CD4B5E2|nr:protein PHLOEM PROTEIN 2-LIKE A5 [Capsella rubella]